MEPSHRAPGADCAAAVEETVWAPGCRAVVTRPRGLPRGLAVIAHGRNGSASAPWIDAMARAYARRGWAAVAGDLRFSDANAAPGGGANFTIRAHVGDFAALLDWAATRSPVAGAPRLGLAGHSLGALAAAEAAAARKGPAPEHLLAISPALSGRALLEARAALGAPAVEALRREVPGAEREWPGWDAGPALARVPAALGVIVGAEDGLTPPAAARRFFEAGRGRFLSVLPGQHHCPEGAAFDRALDAALDALGA